MKLRKRVLTVVGLCGLMSNLLHADVRQTLLELLPGIFNSRGGDTTRQMKAAAVFFLSFFFGPFVLGSLTLYLTRLLDAALPTVSTSQAPLTRPARARPTVTPAPPPRPSPQIMLLSTHCQVVVSHSRFIFSGVGWVEGGGWVAAIALITRCRFTRLCIIVFFSLSLPTGGGRGQSRYHPIISLTATCQNRVAGNRCAEMRRC